MKLDFLLQRRGRRVSRRKHDERLDDIAASCIGHRDDRGIGDRRVLDQAVLDLRRPDAISGDLEHVVRAALIPEIAVGVDGRDVSGAAPVARVFSARAFGVVEVFEEKHRVRRAVGRDAVNRHFARFALRHGVAVVVDHRDAMPGIGPAHRSRLRRPLRVRIADDVVHLGLAEHLVDRDAQRFLRPRKHRRPHRLARAHDAAQVDVEVLARPGECLHHQLQRGREQERVAHLVFLHQAQRAFRIEAPAIADDRLPEIEGRQQRIHQTAGPRPVGGRPEHVARLRKAVVRVDEAGEVAEQARVRHERALRWARRAAGIDDERRIAPRAFRPV